MREYRICLKCGHIWSEGILCPACGSQGIVC